MSPVGMFGQPQQQQLRRSMDSAGLMPSGNIMGQQRMPMAKLLPGGGIGHGGGGGLGNNGGFFNSGKQYPTGKPHNWRSMFFQSISATQRTCC